MRRAACRVDFVTLSEVPCGLFDLLRSCLKLADAWHTQKDERAQCFICFTLLQMQPQSPVPWRKMQHWVQERKSLHPPRDKWNMKNEKAQRC